MGFSGIQESSAILEALKKILSSYEKKCSTVYALADQIMGMQKCEKDLFRLPQDTFSHLDASIRSKIMEELNGLSLTISEMEDQQSAMTANVKKMETNCQTLFEKGNHDSPEFQNIRTIYAVSNYVATLIYMKKYHLEMMHYDDIKSISKARKDSSCKPVERELEKYIIILSKS